MYPKVVAEQLRDRGHDVVAVTERPALTSLPDHAILAAAVTEGRVLVTDNAQDFIPLALERAVHGASHPGLVLTHDKRYPRGNPRTKGKLVRALDAFLDHPPLATRQPGFIYWLP